MVYLSIIMKKSITPSYSKDFSHSEIHKFNIFYKNSVVNFLINNNLCLVGEQDGFVVKETLDSNKYYGTVLKTTDGGTSWDAMLSGTSDYFNTIRKLPVYYIFVVRVIISVARVSRLEYYHSFKYI